MHQYNYSLGKAAKPGRSLGEAAKPKPTPVASKQDKEHKESVEQTETEVQELRKAIHCWTRKLDKEEAEHQEQDEKLRSVRKEL